MVRPRRHALASACECGFAWFFMPLCIVSVRFALFCLCAVLSFALRHCVFLLCFVCLALPCLALPCLDCLLACPASRASLACLLPAGWLASLLACILHCHTAVTPPFAIIKAQGNAEWCTLEDKFVWSPKLNSYGGLRKRP